MKDKRINQQLKFVLTYLSLCDIIVISPIGGYGGVFMEHKHESTKAVVNRLSRAIGHLESVKQMVEDGRDCSEVLIQLAAVKQLSIIQVNLFKRPHQSLCCSRH